MLCGFRIGTSTVFRYIREALEPLAALARSLAQAIETARGKAFVIVDGSLLRIDRGRHDRDAAREHGLVDALTEAGVRAVADTAYQGGGSQVRVPQRRRRLDPDTCRSQTPAAVQTLMIANA